MEYESLGYTRAFHDLLYWL